MSSIDNKNYVQTTYKQGPSGYSKKFVKQIFKNHTKGLAVLDIGCGNGEISKEIENLGHKVYGLDISDSAKPLLKNQLKNHDLSNKKYPFDDGSFDIVFTKSVVEHLRDPDVLIDEAFRLLKPGGTFICMTPSWKHSYKEQFYIDHTHVTPFTRVSLETICELSGFKASCDYFYQLPFLWKYPYFKVFTKLLNILRLPYRPFYKVPWPNNINKTIRFSKEAMLICTAIKPK